MNKEPKFGGDPIGSAREPQRYVNYDPNWAIAFEEDMPKTMPVIFEVISWVGVMLMVVVAFMEVMK